MAKAVPPRKGPKPALAAPKTLRIPITNVCDGSDYSAQILVGSQQVAANVILDTGSSTLAVTPSLYNAAADKNVKPTKLAQLVLYGTGGWIGPVVNTSMVLGNTSNNVTLQKAPIAITDFQAAGNFDGSIDGIMGLAYYALNDAYQFKTPTYPWPFASGSYNSELQQFHLRPVDLLADQLPRPGPGRLPDRRGHDAQTGQSIYPRIAAV